MYFIIYETVNLKNGRRYRGRHQTNQINDGYLGSGNWIKSAIRKYGLENFERHDLFYAFNYDSLLWAEKEFVNKEWVEESSTYNIVEGGGGSYTKFVNGRWVNVMQIEESKQRRRETLALRYPNGQPGLFSKNNYFGKPDKPDNLEEHHKPKCSKEFSMKKMVETRRSHPLGYHHGRPPFMMTQEKKLQVQTRMIDSNPMKNEEVKQKKRDKIARKFGFSDDRQFTNYIKDLYGVMAMTPNLITRVIGCDQSTIRRRLEVDNGISSC